MKLFNTRDLTQSVEFSEAIVSPMAHGGGLFAPRELPKFSPDELATLRAAAAQNHAQNSADNSSPAGLNPAQNSSPAGLNYRDLAMKIIDKFEFDLPRDEFLHALAAYDEFDGGQAVGFRQLAPNLWMSELWHGKTRAFKDIALAPFGRLLDALGERTQRRFLVLCATSGDTGPATLSAFSGAKNVLVFCIYPAGATSAAQRLQMTTARGANLVSIGIRGNFDDAQRALKSLLADEALKKTIFAERGGLNISAANSVNFGRILFQIIYHFWGALRATCADFDGAGANFSGADGANSLARARYNNVSQNGTNSNLNAAAKAADIIVPSGNFGDALGAFYAKQMGAPIGKILIASNANNILTELFTAGRYDLRGRALIPTMSPAMDILVSSNVERLLFAKFGAGRTRELMGQLAARGFYELAADELAALRADFDARFYTDEQTAAAVALAAGAGELIDPHTATCFAFLDENGGADGAAGGANSNLDGAGAENCASFAGAICPPARPTIITSTAQWVKFTPSMLRAIKGANGATTSNSNLTPAALEFAQMQALAGEFGVALPPQICEIFTAPVRHNQVVEVGELAGVLVAWAKSKI